MSKIDHELRKKLTRQEGWISIVVNVLLFGLKYWAGVVSGSLALIADAWHTLSDSISSILVLVSARFSYKKADKDHPFGHGRFELVATIFIGVLLVLIGVNFIKEGIEKLMDHQKASYGMVAIVVTVVSVLLKEGLAQFAFFGARKTGADTLKADAWHHRTDALSSIVILVGIFVGRFVWWVDGALSIVVAFFLLYAAWEIVKKSISSILGENADPKLLEQVKKIVYTTAEQDVYPHHVHLHNYVLHKELTFHIALPPEYTITKAHLITDRIEKEIKEQLDIEATIHIDPINEISEELKKPYRSS